MQAKFFSSVMHNAHGSVEVSLVVWLDWILLITEVLTDFIWSVAESRGVFKFNEVLGDCVMLVISTSDVLGPVHADIDDCAATISK